MMPPV